VNDNTMNDNTVNENTVSESTAAPAGYAAALTELEAILGRLERSDVDVDILAAEVQRAATLIAFCRDSIGSARLQIEQVVADLGDTA
jgi:exodeoxyribonuclease VII small subunit